MIFYPGDMYWKDPIKILYINEGGLGIYGGIIGGLLGGIIMAKIHKMKIPAVLDIAVQGSFDRPGNRPLGKLHQPGGLRHEHEPALGHVQRQDGKLSCQPAGFSGGGWISVDPAMPVHPTFLYESLWCLLGVLVLYWFSKKFQKYNGQVFFLYLIWYGVERFVVEGLRTDSLMIGSFRVSQIVAVVSALAGLVLLIVFRNKGKVEEEYVPVYARPAEPEGLEGAEAIEPLESETAAGGEIDGESEEKKNGEPEPGKEPETDDKAPMGDSTPEETAAGGDGEVKAAGDVSTAVDEKTEAEAVPGEGAGAAELGTEENSEEK